MSLKAAASALLTASISGSVACGHWIGLRNRCYMPSVMMAQHWSLRTLREKLIKIEAKVVSGARYVVFLMAEVAIPR